MVIPPKASYRFNVINIQSPIAFFIELKNILEFIQKPKSLRKAKVILNKNNNAGCITLLIPHRAILTKITWH